MYIILQKVFAVVLAAECFVGITINVFISAVQIMKWKAVKSLESCDQILLCLAISRSLSLTSLSFDFIIRAYFPLTFLDLIIFSVVTLPRILLYYTSFWFTTVLCVFYCVKIANYKNRVFLYMKTRISKLVPQLIGASLLISLAFTIPFFWYFFQLHRQTLGNHFVGKVNMNNSSFEDNHRIQTIVYILGSSLPFLIFCGAVSLLIQSLWLHTRQMRRSGGSSFQDPKLEAHFSVVKSMTLFLCFQIIYFVCAICMFSLYVNFTSPWKMFIYVLACVPSGLHSSYMVYSNTKLKQAFLEMWHSFQRCI
ncbi:taste receptor type 2 member 40-like [Hyperolius riggenbachi]|uniref:taste receptor type 2 member 40-like n=1 Tax=Hyperolius riggenbachi TaxID=752182 RepID=UPI0035A2C68D